MESAKERRIQRYLQYRKLADRVEKSDYQVSKEAGFSNVTFSDWKAGKSEPKIDKILKIAAVLGVSVNDLLKEEA